MEIDHAAKPKKSKQSAGFLKTTWWSVVVVAFTPLLVVLYPCLRNKEYVLGRLWLPSLPTENWAAHATLLCALWLDIGR